MGIFENAKKQMRRSPYQAIAAVIMMFLTFLLGGMVFLFVIGSTIVLGHFEGKPQITVFLKDGATQEAVSTMMNDLAESGKAKTITYISKQDALRIYQEQNKDDPLLLEMVTADILPASLEVSAVDPALLSDLKAVAEGYPDVEEIVYQKDIVDTLVAWTNAIRLIGTVFALLFMLVAVFTLMMVVGMKIALKRDEIEILNLVGASNSYVRGPFLLEGMIYGVTGSFLAWLVIFVSVLWTRMLLLGFLSTIPEFQTVLSDPTSPIFLGISAALLGLHLVAGLMFGGTASYFAVRRFLRFMPNV